MKKLPILMFMLACFGLFSPNYTSGLYGMDGGDSIKVWSSPDLEELTSSLVRAYHKENPAEKIIKVTSQFPEEAVQDDNKIGLITKSYFSNSDLNNSWRLAIGRDILVPVMNPENPFRDEIEDKGISPQEFRELFTRRDSKTWGLLLGNGKSSVISCWCLPDPTTRSYLANFFDTAPSNIESNNAENLEELLNNIAKDKYALGFCRLANVLNPDTKKLDSRITPVPIDINNNNEVDYFEDIYSTINELERGVWIGKFPKELYSCIYLVNSNPPVDENQQEFMKWLLTKGQDYLFLNGYSELVFSERTSKIQSVLNPVIPVSADAEKAVNVVNAVMIILVILGVAIGVYLLFKKRRSIKEEKIDVIQRGKTPAFGEYSVKLQGGLFFDKSHTWAFMEKNGIVKTGIDDFLQHVTGRITKVKMKTAGEKVTRGEIFLTLVQEGKHLEIKSPVSGIIVNTNEKLIRNPSLLNTDPLTDGWIYSVETANWTKDLRLFLLGEEYISWLKNEFSRLKDFLSIKIKPHSNEEFYTIMQEGGELKDGLLEYLGPKVWEEFQAGFINK